MDLKRFTTRAQEAVQGAQESAVDRGNPRIELEHLFSVLLADPEALVPQILERSGVSPGDARAAFDEALSRFPQSSGDGARTDGSPELMDVLRTAEKEAKKLKDEYVSVEHLLVSLADRDNAGPAQQALEKAGATPEAPDHPWARTRRQLKSRFRPPTGS